MKRERKREREIEREGLVEGGMLAKPITQSHLTYS